MDAKGNVVFTSYDKDDGLAPGQYRVIVGITLDPLPSPIPDVYKDMVGSPLQINIEANKNENLILDMKKSAGRASKPASNDRTNDARNSIIGS